MGSLHAVRDLSTASFGNLFLPDKPTRLLLAHDPEQIAGSLVEISTRRRGVGSGTIDVELEVRPRNAPLDPDARVAVLDHLARLVCRYFGGTLKQGDVDGLVYSWPVEPLGLC